MIVMIQIVKPEQLIIRNFSKDNPGLDIQGTTVHSCSDGVVTYIGTDIDSRYTVCVQYSTDKTFKYSNLKTISVSVGMCIVSGSLIGYTDKYVHFEYLTSVRGASLWPVRIGSLTHYKQNPTPVLTGEIRLNANNWSAIKSVTVHYDTDYDLTAPMVDEFMSDNRGE